MARTALQYLRMLRNLLPVGRLWNRSESSVLGQVLYGMADEFVRLEGRSEDLIKELTPSTVDELITEWENEYEILEPELTLVRRIEKLKAVFVAVGGQNKEYFDNYLTEYGYANSNILEFTPAWAGIAQAGDPCGDQYQLFKWMVQIDPTISTFVESRMVNLTNIISEIVKRKPAHTMVLFDFYNVEFGRGFGKGFNRIPHYDNEWEELDFNSEFSIAFANNTDYVGANYTGAFDQDFTIAYDAHSGGEFGYNEFGNDFLKPA